MVSELAIAILLIIFLTFAPRRWLFEKYDGIRGFWNPLKHAFFSRFGNKLEIPQHIVDSMPEDTFLDGELWYASLNNEFNTYTVSNT